MDSTPGDGGEEEEKPSDVQLLVDLVSRQMEAAQRREERFIVLMERLCPSSARDSANGAAGGNGGAPDPGSDPALRTPAPTAPGHGPPDPAGRPGSDGGTADPGLRVSWLPGPGRAGPGPAADGAATGDPGDLDLDRGPGSATGRAVAGGSSGLDGDPGRAAGRPAVGGPSDPGWGRPRSRLPAAATPAPRLISSASLKEFEAWQSKFDGYRLLVGLNDLPMAEQRAALLALLDDEWVRIVRFGLPQTTDATVDDLIGAMHHHLRRQRNIIIDRRDFNMRVQQAGETFDEFLCALKETASFCDFCVKCIDDRLRDRLVVGVRDEDARRRMLELPELTLQSAADICRASENASSSTSAIGQPMTSSLAKLSRYQRDKRPQRFDSQRSGEQRSPKSSSAAESREKCTQCGRTAHRDGQSCPAVGRVCYHCQAEGHFAFVCPRPRAGPQRRSRSTSRHRRDPAGDQRVQSIRQRAASVPHRGATWLSDVRVRGLTAGSSPRVQLQLHRPDGGGTATTHWTPDTGAETSAVSLRYAEKFGVQRGRLTPPATRLLSADSREMQCFGTCSITLQLGRIKHAVEVAVVKSLNGPLLSWHDSIKLGILPENYPQQIRTVKSTACAEDDGAQHAEEDEEDVPSSEEAARPVSKKSKPEAQNSLTKTKEKPERPPQWRPKTPGAASRGQPPLHERQEHFAQMKAAFPQVFDSSGPLREMSGGMMEIELTEDAVPFAVRAPRAIPFCWRDEVREQLDDMIRKDVIEPVHHPTPWCHPLVPVPKTSEDGTVSGCRLTVDFTRLNKFVKRPVHPVRSTHDAVASIGTNARFFTKLDAKAGYHQVPIREQDRDLTTFITPWGRFRFRRAAMGLVSSGDVYNQRGDQVLGDVPQTVKVVDDVMAWDTDYNDHLRHVWAILARCEDNGITLNPKKCVFAAETVDFCGFTVGASGYTPDSKKTAAVSSYPLPECLTDLRSFLGLVHQMGAFSPDVARAAEPLRQLLRPKNEWLWTEEHTAAFNEVKAALVQPPVLSFFDPKRRTVLETDAARLKGLGFCLRQQDETGDWHLIQCGSRFLTDTETRYAVIEVEMLAIVWAMKKCAIYLQGMQKFEVATDHRPLVPIFNDRSLQDIANPRLQRLRECLTPFNFVVVWRQGKLNAISDALSRHPVEKPTSEDEAAGKLISNQLSSMIIRAITSTEEDGTPASPFEDAALSAVRAASERDSEMSALREAVMSGFPDHKSEVVPHLRQYWNMRDRLAVDGDLVLCGQRVVIPSSMRKDVLKKLHASHQGEERTKRRARQVAYWPGIDNDITNVVKGCQECRLHLPRQQKEPIIQMPLPSRVFEVVSTDFFEYAGRTYLVYTDRLSGWPWVCHMGRTASAHQLTTSLRQAFAATGVPSLLLSDGGPQFAAKKTRDFLKKWNVKHQLSSPHYPQANGHAEASVKAVKRLIKKVTVSGNLDTDAFAEGLLELRNSPRADGRSPAQVLLGHPLRSMVPAHHSSFARCWRERADECDKRAAEQRRREAERYNASARSHRPLQLGQHVLMQDPRTGLWDGTGLISGISEQRRSFLIRTPSGRICWRNRRFLRPLRPLITESSTTAPAGESPPTPRSTAPEPAASEVQHPERAGERPPTPRSAAAGPATYGLRHSEPASAAVPASPAAESTPLVPALTSPGVSPPSPTASDAAQSVLASPRQPEPIRRGTRNRRRPDRLQVRWGACTYDDTV